MHEVNGSSANGERRPATKLSAADVIRLCCVAVFGIATLAPIPFQHWHEVRVTIWLGHGSGSSSSVYDHTYAYLQALEAHEGEWKWITFIVLAVLSLWWERLERRFAVQTAALTIFRAGCLFGCLAFVALRNWEIVIFGSRRTSLLAETMLYVAAVTFIAATFLRGLSLRKRKPRLPCAKATLGAKEAQSVGPRRGESP